MCGEIFEKKKIMMKCLFYFYEVESYFNNTNFDTTFPEFSLGFNHEQNSNA